MTADNTVAAGKTLTIDPGVEIQMVHSRITVKGTLIANGTIADSVRFIGNSQVGFVSGKIMIREFATNNSFRYCRFDKLGFTSIQDDWAIFIVTPDCVSNINFDGFGGAPSIGSALSIVVKNSSCTINNISEASGYLPETFINYKK